MLKRLLTIAVLTCAVVLALMLSASAEVVGSGYCGAEGDGKNLTWALGDDGTLVIYGEGRMADYNCEGLSAGVYVTNAPWEFGVTKVIIQEGVTTIGDEAFSTNRNLTSVDMPESLTSIGFGAFIRCGRLGKIELHEGIKTIEDAAFWRTGLKNVTIPESVSRLGWATFYFCQNLQEVFIPDSVTYIGEEAFLGCENLSDIYYGGYESQWNSIRKGNANAPLHAATIHCRSKTCFNVYVDGMPTLTDEQAKQFLHFLYDYGGQNVTALDVTQEDMYRLMTGDVSGYNGNLQRLQTDLIAMSLLIRAQTAAKIRQTGQISQRAAQSALQIMMQFVPDTCLEYAYKASKNDLKDYASAAISRYSSGAIAKASGHTLTKKMEAAIEESAKKVLGVVTLNDMVDWLNGMIVAVQLGNYYANEQLEKAYVYLNNYLNHRGDVSSQSDFDRIYGILFNAGTPYFQTLLGVESADETKQIMDAWGEYVYQMERYAGSVPSGDSSISHAWDGGTITKEAACVTDGVLVYMCSRCGAKESEAIPAHGHSWYYGGVKKAATCTADGVSWDYCGYCAEDRTGTIPAYGHAAALHEVPAVSPTCTSEGNVAYWVCADCGQWFSDAAASEQILDKSSVLLSADSSNHTERMSESYEDHGDKNHTRTTTWTCDACGETISSTTQIEACADDNADSSCDLCGGSLPVIPATSGYCGGEGDGTNLTWTLTDDGRLIISGEGIMADYAAKAAPWYSYVDSITRITIKEGVTSIGTYAFYYCTKLTKAVLPDSLTSIGNCAFYYCRGLSGEPVIPENVQTIGSYAFYSCTNLTGDLSIPDSVALIDAFAFYGASNLGETVTMGKNVATIGRSAFETTDVTQVYFTGDAPTVTEASSDFRSFDEDVSLYCADGTSGWRDSDVYDSAAGTWNGYSMNAPEGVETVDISGATMFLESELSLNFAVLQSDFTAKEEYTATITRSVNGEVQEEIVVPGSAWAPYSNNIYYTIPVGIAAAELADDLSIEIIDADGHVVNNAYTTSGRTYAMNMLNGSSSEVLKTLIVDMLNYGAQAQITFDHNVDDLANAEMTAEQLALGTVDELALSNSQKLGGACVGTALELEQRILVKILFSGITDTTGMHATISYENLNGELIESTVPAEELIYSNGYYGVEVNTVAPAEARSMITVTMYDADGNVYGYGTDSIEGYAQRQISNNRPLATMCDLIMRFADSSKAYLGK